jgi:peptide/nickel transport system substrate-binding protein
MQLGIRFRAIALACVGLFVIAACGGGGETTNVKEGGTLTFVIDADAQTLNPFEVGDLPSARAVAPMFPNLYMADKNLSIVPDLADGMPTVSSDLKTWTVKLRKNAKWSDGSAITANDVVTTVRIEANSKLDTDAAFDWSPLTDPVNGVTAKDDNTVVFTLTSTFAPFLAVNLAGFVAPASVYGKIDPAKMRNDPSNTKPTVTGGPFLFDKWIPGQEIDLVANPNYYAGKPHIAKIKETVITNTTAAAQAVVNGDVNWDPEVVGAAVSTVQNVPGVNTYIYPDLGYYDVRFNDRQKWINGRASLFGDVNVRRAFAYALDKDSMVKAATDGHGTPLWGDIVPASAYYDESATVKYKQDVAKAKSLMDAAGWTVGSDGIRVKNGQRFSSKFYVRADKPQRIKAVQIMSEQLRAIGMDLQPTPTDFKVFYDPIEAGNYDLALAGWGLALDPDDYTIFHSSFIRPENNKSGTNWTGYVNKDLDAAIDAERTDLKPTAAATFAARKADFAKIEHILGDDVVVYFLWADNTGMAFNGVNGVVPGNGNSLNYADQGRNPQIFATWSLSNPK